MSNQTNQNKTSTEGKRGKWKPWVSFLGFLLLCWVVSTSMVIVSETESVIVERLGQIVAIYDQSEDKGLHGKFPWPIETVRKFDNRIQIYDPPGREFFTKDKKNIVVDTYLCWKIAEASPESNSDEAPVLKFFRSYGNPKVAEARLDSRLRSIVSTQLGKIDLSELLNAPGSDTAPESKPESQLDRLSSQLLEEMKENDSRSLSAQSGIEIVDVRIKRINLPYGNQQAVYERMKSERKKIADRYRSAGLAENQMIRSQADRYYNEFIAKAEAESEKIRGDAEAKAVEIVNKAHARDPEFYQLLQTLDSYEKIINEKTSLFLSAQSPLLKIFSNGVELKGENTEKESEKSIPETTPEKKTEDNPSVENPTETRQEES